MTKQIKKSSRVAGGHFTTLCKEKETPMSEEDLDKLFFDEMEDRMKDFFRFVVFLSVSATILITLYFTLWTDI